MSFGFSGKEIYEGTYQQTASRRYKDATLITEKGEALAAATKEE